MRELTCKVIEAIDAGLLDAKAVAEMCLGYMNEDDIREMLRQNDVLEAVEPDDDDEDDDTEWDLGSFDDDEDDDTEWDLGSFDDGDALASAGWGTDEDYGLFSDDDPF